jgi:ribonuclease HI
VKVNVDTSFSADNLEGGIGAVIRDEWGHLIATATCIIPHVSSACSEETLVLWNILYLARHMGCHKIMMESDCAAAMEALQDTEDHMGQDAAITVECHQLSMQFGRTTLQHCHRETNEVADILAKTTFSSRSSADILAVPLILFHQFFK